MWKEVRFGGGNTLGWTMYFGTGFDPFIQLHDRIYDAVYSHSID